MTHSLNSKKLIETDMAYEVLKARGNPMHYQSLIEEVFKRAEIPREAAQIAAVLTQINLDARFEFYGRGEWGLRAWKSSKIQKSSSSVTSIKASSEEDEKTGPEELEEESIEEDRLESDEDVDELGKNSYGGKW